jgi:hypothetical protein
MEQIEIVVSSNDLMLISTAKEMLRLLETLLEPNSLSLLTPLDRKRIETLVHKVRRTG